MSGDPLGHLINVNDTIHGYGQIGVNRTQITNQASGTIDADVRGQTLNIDPNASGLDSFFDADFNVDGKVDGDDFLIWQTGLGQFPGGDATQMDGDADEDGYVDGDDFLVWQNQFGSSVGGPEGSGSAAVPEPGAGLLALAMLAIVGMLSGSRFCRR